MKDLIAFLSGIENKTGLITKLLAVLIMANIILPSYVTADVIVWVDMIALIALLFFKFFASSGHLPKGWTFWFYVINGCLFALEGISLVSATVEINPLTMAKIIAAINGIYALAQFLNESKTSPTVADKA
jgi:hypothetical protein